MKIQFELAVCFARSKSAFALFSLVLGGPVLVCKTPSGGQVLPAAAAADAQICYKKPMGMAARGFTFCLTKHQGYYEEEVPQLANRVDLPISSEDFHRLYEVLRLNNLGSIALSEHALSDYDGVGVFVSWNQGKSDIAVSQGGRPVAPAHVDAWQKITGACEQLLSEKLKSLRVSFELVTTQSLRGKFVYLQSANLSPESIGKFIGSVSSEAFEFHGLPGLHKVFWVVRTGYAPAVRDRLAQKVPPNDASRFNYEHAKYLETLPKQIGEFTVDTRKGHRQSLVYTGGRLQLR